LVADPDSVIKAQFFGIGKEKVYVVDDYRDFADSLVDRISRRLCD
jgi:hypothetical protein